MARATFVKAARKNNSVVKKGEPYYWWKFKRGGKHYSKTKPKPSQLTQSDFWSAVYGLQESHEDQPEYDDLEGEIDTIKGELESIRDDTQGKFDNLPENFQNGQSGEQLQGRIDAIEEAINTLDGISVEFDEPDKEDPEGDETQDEKDQEHADAIDEAKKEAADNIWSEVSEALTGISCD